MFGQAWRVQKRVLGAVLMREIQIRWGRRNLGFAWIFAEPLLFAFPVLVMWSYMRSPFEHGVPLMPFIWSGYLPLLMFRHITGHSIYAVRSSAAMLYHRTVTPFDLIIGRCGLQLMGSLAATAASFLILHMLGVLDWPYDLPLFIVGTLYMAWWSIAIALIVAAGSERSDIVEHIWQPISYIYLPLSGFMYLAVWLPTSIRDLALTVMPSLQAYEIIRAGLIGNLVQTFYSMTYLTFVLAVLTIIGLWLVRGVRQHLEVEW